MEPVDSVSEGVFLGLGILLLGEDGFRVGNVNSSIDCTLKSGEDSVSRGGSGQTEVQEAGEGSLLNALFLSQFGDVDVFTGGFGDQVELGDVVGVDVSLLVFCVEDGQQSSGGEETSAVSGRVVGQPSLETESFELEGVSRALDLVAGNCGPDNLADYSLVGSSDHESPFRSVVLVLFWVVSLFLW